MMRRFILVLLAVVLGTAAAAQDGYRIRPGDVLAVEVLQDATLNREVLVLPDGRFSFPFAGTLVAGGRTVDEVQQSIKSGIASNFAVEPTVFVSVRQLVPPAAPRAAGPVVPVTIDIFFLGEFASPGAKALPPGTTFLQALAAGGAFTSFAAQKRIQLRRTDASGRQSVTTINYRAIADGARLSQDPVLQDGDIILAPERRLFE
jgi:polysaccharide export outer membrane protein